MAPTVVSWQLGLPGIAPSAIRTCRFLALHGPHTPAPCGPKGQRAKVPECQSANGSNGGHTRWHSRAPSAAFCGPTGQSADRPRPQQAPTAGRSRRRRPLSKIRDGQRSPQRIAAPGEGTNPASNEFLVSAGHSQSPNPRGWPLSHHVADWTSFPVWEKLSGLWPQVFSLRGCCQRLPALPAGAHQSGAARLASGPTGPPPSDARRGGPWGFVSPPALLRINKFVRRPHWGTGPAAHAIPSAAGRGGSIWRRTPDRLWGSGIDCLARRAHTTSSRTHPNGRVQQVLSILDPNSSMPRISANVLVASRSIRRFSGNSARS